MYLLTQFNNGCNNCHNSIECDTKQPFYWWQSHRHCKHCHTVNSNFMQPKTFFVQTLFPMYFPWVAYYIPLSFSMTFLSSSPTKCRSCRLHPLKPISIFQSFSKVLYLIWIFIGHCSEKPAKGRSKAYLAQVHSIQDLAEVIQRMTEQMHEFITGEQWNMAITTSIPEFVYVPFLHHTEWNPWVCKCVSLIPSSTDLSNWSKSFLCNLAWSPGRIPLPKGISNVENH